MKYSEKCQKILNILKNTVSDDKVSVVYDNEENNSYQFLFGKQYDGLEISFSYGLHYRGKDMSMRMIYCKSEPVAIYFEFETMVKINNIMKDNVADKINVLSDGEE